jgi:Xaa-Pro aminopeptidase
MATLTGLATADLDGLRDQLAKDVGADGVRLLVVPAADPAVSALVDDVRGGPDAGDDELGEAASELRLVKDAYEVAQLRGAVAATVEGFEQVVLALPRAMGALRGERVVEGTFLGHARTAGNYVGYETIAAAGPHATTLHWTDDDGPVRAGDLLLLDAGVEARSLYTADVTRTLPIDGRFTDVQRRVYQAVLDAADAAFAVARPGTRFRDVHGAAMQVLADRLAEWGLLPVEPQVALAPDQQQHRRWMVHGTSHHLGLDVHDCAAARAAMYLDVVIEPGMVFTIEPGLYFQPDDLLVPAQYRGIGVRIEDDVLITADGCENLSAALPREPDEVEAWMAGLLGR